MAAILDQHGHAFPRQAVNARREVVQLRHQIANLEVRGKYDGASVDSDMLGNHWANADHLSPDAANSFGIRRKLRARSRYEVNENNPYLKGMLLTIANDFVGSGPKLKITDKRLPKAIRRHIERRWAQWAKAVRYRQKLWQLRGAKLSAGEGIKVAIHNPRLPMPVKLDFRVVEADQLTTQGAGVPTGDMLINEVDGIRFDDYGNPAAYYFLDNHPGSNTFTGLPNSGHWVPAKWVTHWFRKDRPWKRGIPETTPSLPLCALLRRYTLAVILAAETAADHAAVMTSDGPPNQTAWTDGNGNQIVDEPFDAFPIEKGMIVNLPWGADLKQFDPKHPSTMYDKFVETLLREIARPLLTPYNIAAGTSKDSNMASAVLDSHIYAGGQTHERHDCEDDVLDPDFRLFWEEARLYKGYLAGSLIGGDGAALMDAEIWREPPEHGWGWDRVIIEHTDPQKVVNALKIAHDKGFITDRFIQETRYNRDVDEWREEIEEQMQWRKKVGMTAGESEPNANAEEEDEETDGDS